MTGCTAGLPWTGMSVKDGKSVAIGHFESLESCERKMKELGGYCGKGCKDYEDGTMADCDPLVQVRKQ